MHTPVGGKREAAGKESNRAHGNADLQEGDEAQLSLPALAAGWERAMRDTTRQAQVSERSPASLRDPRQSSSPQLTSIRILRFPVPTR
jgi:hypothetical protein